MIARNFYSKNFNILKPEVDWKGNEPSVAELEFQITTFLTAILYIFFGVKDWVGRIIPILFSLLATIYIYRLIKFYFEEKPALFTAFVYSILPLNVFFTRVPMPDSGMLFFSIASLYHFSSYIKNGNNKQFILAIIFTSLAFLSKLPGLCILIPLAFIPFSKYKFKVILNKKVWLFFLLTLAITVSYYVYIHYSADIKIFPYKIGTDKWGTPKIWQDSLFYITLYSRFKTIIFTPIGLVLLAFGLFLTGRNIFFHIWLFSVILYFFAVGKGNQVHSYYQLPIIPVGSLFIGLTLYNIYRIKYLKYFSFVLCIALFYVSIPNLLPLYGMYAYPSYEAAMKLKEIDRENSLILSVPYRKDVMPELLYYANRKGWVIPPEQLSFEKIEEYKNKGVKYMVMIEPYYLDKNIKKYLGNEVIYKEDSFAIVKLKEN